MNVIFNKGSRYVFTLITPYKNAFEEKGYVVDENDKFIWIKKCHDSKDDSVIYKDRIKEIRFSNKQHGGVVFKLDS